MFAGKNESRVLAGYDLGKDFSQISFCQSDGSEAETVSSVAGTEQYNIPTVLCKRKGVNQWFYGKEALKYAQEEEGILVENLLMLADRGEDVIVEGEAFDPVALLTLFVKRSLSLLNMRIPLNRVEAIMFTVEELTTRMVDVLAKVAVGLQLKDTGLFFQSHVESFYYYMLYQQEELWKNDVLVFDYSSHLKSRCLECNRRTSPRVVFITCSEFPGMKRMEWAADEETLREQKKQLDEQFLTVAEGELEGRIVSTVYLIGDGFKEGWAAESLRLLCRSRRVFQGNNLYSRGACFGAVERMHPGERGQDYVYLGNDKLKSNIGMRVLRRGEESYFAILDAGQNWYEASLDFEVILEEGNTIDFVITPLTGGPVVDRQICLLGLPERPKKTTRLKIHLEMAAVDQAAVTIEDMGFGELFPSSGKGWTQTLRV